MSRNLFLPRRKDRTQNDAWIRDFVLHGEHGVLSTTTADQPYAYPSLYAFDVDKHALYFHGALRGRKRDTFEENPKACFTISQLGRFLPNAEAAEFSVEFASALLFGTIIIVDSPDEKYHGLQLLMGKYFPHLHSGEHYPAMVPNDFKGTMVYRLDIQAWSGKAKTAPPDFPGAFSFSEVKA